MDIRVPDYYVQFHCLAEKCPHSCCSGWEVVIDPATAEKYRTLPGELGDKLRRSLQSEDGEYFFSLTASGRCPFWNGDNLCEIHRAVGASCTSEVCQSHPRFIEDYGSLRETTLCASCPEACRLLLSSTDPLTFPLHETDDIGEPADEWLSPLLKSRSKAFNILQNRHVPLRARFEELLVFAAHAQAFLEMDDLTDLPAFCQQWTAPQVLSSTACDGLFPNGLDFLLRLEILGEDWRALLNRRMNNTPTHCPDELLERIAAYFLFRYYLKAINDADLLSRVELIVFSVLTVDQLAHHAGISEALRLYCHEIEHNEDNLNSLLAAFQGDPSFSYSHFLSQLQNHW